MTTATIKANEATRAENVSLSFHAFPVGTGPFSQSQLPLYLLYMALHIRVPPFTGCFDPADPRISLHSFTESTPDPGTHLASYWNCFPAEEKTSPLSPTLPPFVSKSLADPTMYVKG